MKPSGVQLIIADGAARRTTRTNSSAAAWWCGANIAPTQDITTSKLLSAKGIASASASTHSSSTPAFCGDSPPDVEQLGREVAGGDDRARRRGRNRRVARAGSDIQYAVTGRDPACSNEFGPNSGINSAATAG